MASVKVEIKGVDSLLMRFDKIRKIDLTKKVTEITTLVHGQAKALAPVDSGNLRGSIHMDVKDLGSKITGRVYTNVQYAPYVEFGTGVKGSGTYPYKVKGLNLTYRDNGWCYWSDKEEKFIYTTGQVAQPYMYPALKRSTKQAKLIFKAGVHESLKDICKGG